MPRRTLRILAVLTLLVGGVAGLYRVTAWLVESGPQLEANQILLPALSLALLVVTLGLAGVLIRNLVKLIVERKRGILGSKLRTKLVFFFVALVLLPATVLFIGSAQVIKQTVEAISRTRPEDLTRQSRRIVDQWTEFFEAQSLRRARALAEEIARGEYLEPGRRAELEALIQQRRLQEDLGWIEVESGGRTVAAAGEKPDPEIRTLLSAAASRARTESAPVSDIQRLPGGLLAHAAAPVDPAPGMQGPAPLVLVGVLLPGEIAGDVESIDAAAVAYRQFRVQRRGLVRLYLTLIGLIFLATLFVATWIGFYLSRRITVPIQDLAAATREIAAGNLGVRVRTRVGDEMGTLVDAFNEMAAELQESREVITRSTADLRDSNRALEERRRYIETLVANLSTGVISLDPDGRVTTVNPAVAEILGVRLAAGDDARSVLTRNELDPLGRMLDDALESESESPRRDLELTCAGAVLNLSVQISPLKGRSAENLGTLIMVEDLTDRLRAQKALAWREVARRIAHEIKNPLTPIQLAAQRLRKKFFAGAPDLDQVLLESTSAIEREVTALKQLVDEFSKFARMPEVTPRPVEFAKVVESVLALYKGLTGIDWDVELDQDNAWVTVDAQQMRRVLINLIDNAVRAMDGNGIIRIVARAPASDGTLRIEVADSGPGIPAGDRDKMFVPYFSTRKRGTGLGLAIVHKVVTDHRGTIRVEDNRPHGARFVIEIPARTG